MSEAENIKQFLSGNRRELISIQKLELMAGLPKRTLQGFLDGNRGLPDHHANSLARFLTLIGYVPVSNEHRMI